MIRLVRRVVGDGVAHHLAGVQVDHGRGVDPPVDHGSVMFVI